MWSPWLSATLLLSVSGVSLSARMLALLTTIGKSHFILQFSVLKALAERGHQVEMYSFFPPPSPVENITHKLLNNDVMDGTVEFWTYEEFKKFSEMNSYFGFGMMSISELLLEYCEKAFQSEHFQNLLKSNDTFDLVFWEGMESMALFSHKFKAPIVTFYGIGDWTTVDWMSGNSLSVAHIPDRLSFGFTNRMSFMERFQNAVSTTLTLLYYHMIQLPRHQQIIERYYKDPTTPHISDLLKNIAITLTNDCPTLGYPRPYTPNIIPIGGAHISTHMTPLPQDVKNFMDDATEGVIFFSLGTIVPLHIFPEEYLKSFLNTFKKLPVRVLWKTDLQSLPDLPENVKLVKWVPQPSVLAHPNCRMFITHGGLMSQHEVLHAGVPVVAIPFFADQRYVVRFYEYLGVGVKLDFSALSEDSVFKAVTTVLNDRRYKQNAEKMSRIVRDQPISPMDSAVYWVEYVLRHRDTQHLRPASAELRWYQLWLLDVAAAMFISLLLTLLALYKIIRWTLNLCCGRSRTLVSSDKKRK